jgi:Amt family ammonium transporter
LAYSYALGKRNGHGTQTLNFRPHNVTHIVIGTVFLWVGWFGFNAGSAMSANLRAVMAAVVTNLAAGCGGITWCLVDYRLEGKWSVVGFCSGVIAGLVAITPASGYVPAWSAVPIGVIAGIGCNFATQLKYWISADDALDIFAVHGIGGLIGNILTAFFAADYIAHLDGVTEIEGGWLNRNWKQLGYQLADSAAGMTYSFVLSMLILYILNLIGRVIPCMRLRANVQEQELGIDDVELGEFAYDYVELIRDIKPLSMLGEEYDADEIEAQSQRSHSQATMMSPEKGGNYPMRSLSRGPGEPRVYDGGVGIAS